MKLKRCGCDIMQLVRVERDAWMRVVPGSGHYQCRACGATMLLSRAGVDAARVAQVPPARPVYARPKLSA